MSAPFAPKRLKIEELKQTSKFSEKQWLSKARELALLSVKSQIQGANFKPSYTSCAQQFVLNDKIFYYLSLGLVAR